MIGNSSLSMKGFVTVSVIDHEDKVVREYPTQPNLLLDRGLNALAVDPDGDGVAGVSMAELFAWSIKGTGTTQVKEVVTTGNNYTLTVSGNLGTLTRASGSARDFTLADVGKLVRQVQTAPFIEGIITDFVSAGVVTLRPIGTSPNFTGQTYANKDIAIYSVNATAVDGENGRTNTYSTVATDNSTTDTLNARLLKRTFIFDTEDPTENVEAVTGTYNYAINPDNNLFGRITRITGSRNWTSADVGKYIQFPNKGNQYAKITALNPTSPTSVIEVDRAPSAPFPTGGQGINPNVFGYISYGQVGFSNSATADPNIIVTLDTPVLVLGPNPETTGQRLKVTYQFQATFTPSTITTQSSGFVAGANAGNMAASQAGNFVIEALGSSRVDQDGGSLLDSLGLEPGFGGSMALSTSTAALVPVGTGTQPSRAAGAPVDLTPLDYVADSFFRLKKGTFDINDSVGSTWRAIGIYDEGSSEFLFTYLFNTNQQKQATTTLTFSFSCTWNRDLSV